MGDDLQANLSMYKLQLQQVDESLSSDPDNEDLKKLRTDLLEVIELTLDLIGQNQPAATDDVTEVGGASGETMATKRAPVKHWLPGDRCLAMWSKDKNFYEATVDEVLEDGSCTVTFDEYGNTDLTEVSLLKPADNEKDKLALEREYKRKKNQKKAQRRKELEEETESVKNKWLDFNVKTFAKTSKGKVKKSIFATPDSVIGKVGVGTCGQGGRPMTKFQGQDKWKK
ncbi:SPF30-like protein [Mya arenaria]|uniref:Survival of motor neuron-related-splicing factor 30 n=1 Tax=Mya arenaria TaxID=6604 RepID=A0ABY7F0V5_MYAAR|nr:SPF30-like protein [Mya arenaria]